MADHRHARVRPPSRTLQIVTGIAGRQPVNPPSGAARATSTRVRSPPCAARPATSTRLGLQRDGVRDEPAARAQRGPAGVEHARGRDPAADEDGVRRRAARPAPPGARPRTTCSDGTPSASAFAAIRAARAASALDGDRPARPVRAQPLDPDRPVARPDVPQQLAGPRREVGEGDGADLALGELPVVVVGVVGQARHLGADRRIGVGDARDGDDVERVAGRVRPVARGAARSGAPSGPPSRASTVIADAP